MPKHSRVWPGARYSASAALSAPQLPVLRRTGVPRMQAEASPGHELQRGRGQGGNGRLYARPHRRDDEGVPASRVRVQDDALPRARLSPHRLRRGRLPGLQEALLLRLPGHNRPPRMPVQPKHVVVVGLPHHRHTGTRRPGALSARRPLRLPDMPGLPASSPTRPATAPVCALQRNVCRVPRHCAAGADGVGDRRARAESQTSTQTPAAHTAPTIGAAAAAAGAAVAAGAIAVGAAAPGTAVSAAKHSLVPWPRGRRRRRWRWRWRRRWWRRWRRRLALSPCVLCVGRHAGILQIRGSLPLHSLSLHRRRSLCCSRS